MDVFQAMRDRRSIRLFSDGPVSDEDVMKLVDAAKCAPSAGNIQPWEFIVVRQQKLKQDLSVAALNQAFIKEAPVIVVVCANQVRSSQGYGSRGAGLYCLQDTAAAVQNLLLAVCALGLGACWVGAFREEEVRKILKIPEGVRPVAIIPVGHAAQVPAQPPRRPVAEIVHRESFGQRSTYKPPSTMY